MQPEAIVGRSPESLEIEFKGGRKALFSNPRNIPFENGDYAVVDIDRGQDVGRVIREGEAASRKQKEKGAIGHILRRATPEDLVRLRQIREQESEAHRTCQQCIAKQGLPMKLVDVESQFDGNKIRFYFTSDRRVDFRKLVRDLAGIFRTRIEMRQIGVRDEARRLGGYGRCGRYYCCRGVIADFDPVTLKMVKEQHLAPGSPKISGGCGRLMCCLRYERSLYADAGREYPKLGTRIEIGEKKAKVVAVDIFRSRISLSDEQGTTTTMTLDEFKKARVTAVGTGDGERPIEEYWDDAEAAPVAEEEQDAA
jgi:cell fate regulator YaaT (PSP1 superfamily)